MSVSDIVNRYNDSLKGNKLVCTKKALEEYIICGLVMPYGKKYKSRQNQELDIEILKEKTISFDIDLSNIINECERLSKENKIKRVYCMTQRCYKEYKEAGYIITKDNKDYFRIFTNELWLVNIVE